MTYHGKIQRDEPHDGANALQLAMRATRPAFLTAIIFGFFINLFGLAGPIYMLQVYDRVLTSRNLATLVALTLIVAFIYATTATLEALRAKLLIRSGVLFDQTAHADVFRAVQKASVLQPSARHAQCLKDIDTIREFYTGSGLLACCDIPWVPIYLAAAFFLNPLYGVLAVAAGLITFSLAAANEWLTRRSLDQASRSAHVATTRAISTFRNAEVLQAMGMTESLRLRWAGDHEAALNWQSLASDHSSVVISATRFTRMFLQSLVLGLGAYLVIQRQVTPGMMIAASIIVGKALSPVEIAIGQWKQFTATREARRRLTGLLQHAPSAPAVLKLPDPRGRITFENVGAHAPGRHTPILSNVTLDIPAGAVFGLVGPSAAGKSSLLRVMTGVWPPSSGTVRLDGSELSHWNPDDLGRNIGYLPQDVELFPGTVGENISRFAPDADAKEIIAAAEIASVHEMIQQLADGYNTQIGEGGHALSGGQRQLIGLARALYGLPALVVLDEPDSSLDLLGERALLHAIATLKRVGRSVVIVSHKQNILSLADFIAVMHAGRIQAVGPREQIVSALLENRVVALPDTGRGKVQPVSAA